MQTDKRFKRFSKGSELIQFAKTEAVIYTRVAQRNKRITMPVWILN